MPHLPKQETLLNELRALRDAPAFVELLANKLCEYAFYKGVDIFDEFLAVKHGVPPAVVEAFSTPEARDYMDARLDKLKVIQFKPDKDKAEAKAERRAEAQRSKAAAKAQQVDAAFLEQVRMRDLSVALIGKHFLASFEGNYQPYRRHGDDVLEIMEANLLKHPIAHAIKDEAFDLGIILDNSTLNAMIGYWENYAERIPTGEEVPPRRRMDEPGWCLSRPTLEPDESIPCPTWDSFFQRCDDPEVVMAYVAMIYYHLAPKNRQILYISEEGQGGKTEFLLALSRLIGKRVVKSINHDAIKGGGSRFFTSSCVGKALVIVPDNMNSKIIMTGVFKEATGHDLTSTEKKFQNPRDVELKAKGIVCSNFEPDISRERSNRTRTLWVRLNGLPPDTVIDPHWPDQLDAEAPGMLAKALKCFHERIRNGYELALNAKMEAAKAAKIMEFESRHQSVFDKFFTVDPLGRVTVAELYECLHEDKEGPEWNNQEIHNFIHWLFVAQGIDRTHNDKLFYYTGMRRKTKRDHLDGGGNPNSRKDTLVEDRLGDGFTMQGYRPPNGKLNGAGAHV